MHMCDAASMSKMIQVRNVPDKLHRELKRRARARGQTLTAYVQRLLERDVARPPIDEVLTRIESRPRIELTVSGSELIREARAERDKEIQSAVDEALRRSREAS